MNPQTFLSQCKKACQQEKLGFQQDLNLNYLTYDFDGPLGLVDLWQLLKINRPDLKDQTFLPSTSPLLSSQKNIFETIAKQDFVLYHPYDSFEVIVDLLKEAGFCR